MERANKGTLYLGMSCNGAPIAHADVLEYLRDTVAKQFPGFSSRLETGWWKGETEMACVVTILGAEKDLNENHLRWLAEQYKTRFQQEAVIYTLEEVRIAWDCWPYVPAGRHDVYHRDGKGY